MSKLSENFILVSEGKMPKSEFLRQSRIVYPAVINQFTSYEDAISILRSRGMLSEEVVYQCKGDKFPLEQIENGIDYELGAMGIDSSICTPGPGDYKKAKEKAIDNLCKDAVYYVKRKACCCDKCETTADKVEGRPKASKQVAKKDNVNKMTVIKPKMVKKSSLQELKRDRYTEEDKIVTQLVMVFLKKTNPETGKKYTEAEAKKKAKLMIKAKKDKGTFGKDTSPKSSAKQDVKETKMLKEVLKKRIVKILNEAATTNLAKLSDENANIQNIPTILNSLENTVTEIESFILKEQTKIQGIFDSIGDIKNEDNIPIGYKFVKPILDSFSKDLQPVLDKISLDNLKLPEAPAEDSENLKVGDSQQVGPGSDPIADTEKSTVFSPRGLKPDATVAESKQARKKYTL